jgi:hypothetical protein
VTDSLKIPDEKRGVGGLTSLFERPDRGWAFWIIVAVLAALNCWWDYYHPSGILFGIIIVIIWAVKSDVRSRK